MRKSLLDLFVLLSVASLAACGGGGSSPQGPPQAGSPAASFSPSSLTFSGQVVGSTSPAQTVTLTNSGGASLAISSITTTGDFAATPTCGATLAASGICTINVTFAPQSGGTENGSLIVTDNAAGSPHSVNLTGTGMAGLVKLSTDTFTNATSQHATEVEPDTFAHGSTIVSVFQVGRFFDGGSSAIGFSTSIDGGATWMNGFLPGITKLQNPANSYDRVSDPTIAYDEMHGLWLAASLPIVGTSVIAPDVIVNRSRDGITWDLPIQVNSTPGDLDKNWIACDNTSTSPFFGNCYVEWDAHGLGNRIQMSTSSNGGLTWSAPLPTANGATGLGGQPLAQPDGTVVVPIGNANLTSILSFVSTDGGASWGSAVTVSPIIAHPVGPTGLVTSMLRSDSLPSADVDANGKVYVVWQDCRFRAGCPSNDIVMSTSMDGLTWTSPVRIPIDAATSTVDHFIPGIAVEPGTAGNTAHLALTYYYYPVASCTTATCQLFVGFASSDDGGATWSVTPQPLAGPMNLSALPQTDQGVMVGDYISTSFVNGLAYGAFAVANPASGLVYDEAIYTTSSGLSLQRSGVRRSSRGERPVVNVQAFPPSSSPPKKIR